MTPEEIAAMQKSNTDLAAALKVAEAAKGGDDNLAELTRLREEKAELITGRDKAKEAKRLEEEKRLTDNAEFKTLSEQLTAERDDLTKQLEGQTEALGKIKERDEATLKTRLEAITDETLRETVKNNSGTLAEKIDLAEKLATVKPGAPGARPAGEGGSNNISRQAFDALTAPAKSEFIKGGGTVTD